MLGGCTFLLDGGDLDPDNGEPIPPEPTPGPPGSGGDGGSGEEPDGPKTFYRLVLDVLASPGGGTVSITVENGAERLADCDQAPCFYPGIIADSLITIGTLPFSPGVSVGVGECVVTSDGAGRFSLALTGDCTLRVTAPDPTEI